VFWYKKRKTYVTAVPYSHPHPLTKLNLHYPPLEKGRDTALRVLRPIFRSSSYLTSTPPQHQLIKHDFSVEEGPWDRPHEQQGYLAL
jgi:hypothetical protein